MLLINFLGAQSLDLPQIPFLCFMNLLQAIDQVFKASQLWVLHRKACTIGTANHVQALVGYPTDVRVDAGKWS